jgi:hypothetical protein
MTMDAGEQRLALPQCVGSRFRSPTLSASVLASTPESIRLASFPQANVRCVAIRTASNRQSLARRAADNTCMCVLCMSTSPVWKSLGVAAAKAASARFRQIGLLPEAAEWQKRLATCSSCKLHVRKMGQSYCGRPFLHQIRRIPHVDGCGCPCIDKAKRPVEHCPLDALGRPARTDGDCNCKWCCRA